MVPPDSVLCDIGCDHGFVSIELVRKRICHHIIAADVRTGPLQRAEEHIREAGLEGRIETRLSDGLDKIGKGEADGFLAAGMGGRLIMHIIEDSLDKIREMDFMILQPQSELGAVRSFLREQGLTVVREDMVQEEGKFYPAMLVQTGPEQKDLYRELRRQFPETDPEKLMTAADQYGPGLILEKNRVLLDYINWWEARQLAILPAVKEHGERLKEVREELERISLVRILVSGSRT